MEGSRKYIFHMQLQTADKGWSSSLGVGWGANNSSPYKHTMLWNVQWCLRPGLIVWYGLRIVTGGGRLRMR